MLIRLILETLVERCLAEHRGPAAAVRPGAAGHRRLGGPVRRPAAAAAAEQRRRAARAVAGED